MTMLTDEYYYISGFCAGTKGRAFEPPTDNYGRAYYLAGFNTARDENIFKHASIEDKKIITLSLEGLKSI